MHQPIAKSHVVKPVKRGVSIHWTGLLNRLNFSFFGQVSVFILAYQI